MSLFLFLLVGLTSGSFDNIPDDIAGAASADLDWDLSLEGHYRDMEMADDGEIVVSDTGLPYTYVQPKGVFRTIPNRCARGYRIKALAPYVSVLKGILHDGVVPRMTQMLQSQGVLSGHPLYDSLRDMLRRLRRKLEISERAMNAMLELNRRNSEITIADYMDHFKTTILQFEPQKRHQCDLMVWFYFVINPAAGKPFRELEVEMITTDAGVTAVRPTGSALKNLIEFELSRVIQGDE
jgi:hypothetical protein